MVRIRLVSLTAGGLFLFVIGAPAMDRWQALSVVESGDDNRAVGPRGEVSRFQIRPELWPGGNFQNLRDALTAAQKVMKPRLEAFEKSHGRPATDFEFYILLECPVADGSSQQGRFTERARRFSKLVRR